MSTSLCLQDEESDLFSANTVNEYYDYLVEKEQDYRSNVTNEDLAANAERKWAIESLEESDNERTVICEQWLSDIHGIEMDDLFTRHSPRIHGKTIQVFIRRLRKGKQRMKRQGDADRWESYFELRLIPLCEFAFENGYGIELA